MVRNAHAAISRRAIIDEAIVMLKRNYLGIRGEDAASKDHVKVRQAESGAVRPPKKIPSSLLSARRIRAERREVS